MWTRALPVIVALVLAVYALIDCLQTDRDQLRWLPRPAWVAVVLLFPIVGPITWLAVRWRTRGFRRRTPRRPTRPPVAPDDNPEFLRQLRRREQELRDKRGDDGEDGGSTRS